MPYYDHHKRSIVKTLGFLAIVVTADFIVTFLITMRPAVTLSIVIYSNIVTGIIYFIHERAWNKIHWGRSKIEIKL